MSRSVAVLAVGVLAACSGPPTTEGPTVSRTTLEIPVPGFVPVGASVSVPDRPETPCVAIMLDDGDAVDSEPLFDLLETSLLARGVAVIRPDGDEQTSLARRRAIRGLIEILTERTDLNSDGVVLVGHGVGGSIAARHAAAFPEDAPWIVLLSSPGLPGRHLETSALTRALRSRGASDQEIDHLVRLRSEVIALARQDANELAIEQAAAAWSSAISNWDVEWSSSLNDIIIEAHDHDWRYAMAYDPRMTMPRLGGVEVLAVQGDADKTFDAAENLHALAEAGRSRAVLIDTHLLPGLDHGLQAARVEGGGQVDSQAIALVADWITERLSRTGPSDRGTP